MDEICIANIVRTTVHVPQCFFLIMGPLLCRCTQTNNSYEIMITKANMISRSISMVRDGKFFEKGFISVSEF